MKCILNKCYGGFSLSEEASNLYNKRKGKDIINPKYGFLNDYGIEPRCDPILVQIVEELGDRANGRFSNLGIIDIPSDTSDLYMDEYDGIETIREGREW